MASFIIIREELFSLENLELMVLASIVGPFQKLIGSLERMTHVNRLL